MSDNPFASPEQTSPEYAAPTSQAIQSKVAAPAIALMVAGVLNVLLCLWGVVASAMMLAGVYPGMAEQQEQMEQMREQMGDNPGLDFVMAMQEFQQGPFSLIMNLIGLGLAVLVIVGGMKMKSLRGYGLSLTAAIVSIIPCFSCCLYGLPIGLWALIVLLSADVKAAFRGTTAE